MSTRGRLTVDVLVDPTVSPSKIGDLERAGFAGAWVTETVRDPFIALDRHSAATTTMTLATGVAIAFARSPMTVALSSHDIQRNSGGRLILGLGSQVKPHIERRFSMPWSEPAARMREYVLALRAIWMAWNEGKALAFSGRFYRHTLMTPFFDPGPTGFGPPPVVVGGVGERMTAVAGEVADGFLCAPLSSPTIVAQRTRPLLGPIEPDFTMCATPFVVTGGDEAAMARAELATRRRIAFYASTPAYRSLLDLHGWAGRGERLTRMSKAGEWDEMASVVDDEMLHAFAVIAEPERVGPEVRRRWEGVVDRVALFCAVDLEPEIWSIVATPHQQPGGDAMTTGTAGGGEPSARIGNVLYPVDDVAAAVAFYEGTFGFTRKFVDGDRYAALDAGGTTLALTGAAEDVTSGIPAASVKVADVHEAVAAVIKAGGTQLRPPESGPHETRAVVRDPWHNTLVVYGPAVNSEPHG